MFTSFDKALVALIGGVVSMLVLLGLDVPEFLRSPEAVGSIAALVSGVLTYFVPNKVR